MTEGLLNNDSNTSKTDQQVSVQPISDNKGLSDPRIPQIQDAVKKIFEILEIKEVYYIDDIFEVLDNYPFFLGKLKSIIGTNDEKKLRIAFQEINFDDPEEVIEKRIELLWRDNELKRSKYLARLYEITGEDVDFKKDSKATVSIGTYFPSSIGFQTMSPSQWQKEKKSILRKTKDSKSLFLFDQVFLHCPGSLNAKKGIDFIAEIVATNYIDNLICGLLTHAYSLEEEFAKRKELCLAESLPIEKVFLLSKKRTQDPTNFAQGIKAALLNSSCEIIKRKTMDILAKANNDAMKRLENIDAHAFDHVIVQSSFAEGVWEPETIFRINRFLSQDYAKEQILNDPDYRKVVNAELDIARGIGRVKITSIPYNDHLFLRNQELYEPGELLNGLNSPIANGDIFEINNGQEIRLYILVSQQCDLVVREEGQRKSSIGVLLEINESTDQSLSSEINSYYKDNPLRSPYFSDKFKLAYFKYSGSTIKNGIVNFTKSIQIDMTVLDLIAFNNLGECKIDMENLPPLSAQFQSIWRNRFKLVHEYFKSTADKLDLFEISIKEMNSTEMQRKTWFRLMPIISFKEELGITPAYTPQIFNFGIKRIMRYRKPNAVLLLNKFTRYLSRDAEEHDFAE